MTNKTTQYLIYKDAIISARDAAKAYYDTDVELMTDAEYDALIELIEYSEKEYGWNESKGLLTQVAAGESLGGDVAHSIKMLSLGKANTFDELKSFVRRIQKETNDSVFAVEPKLDGSAVSITYQNGKLVQVATRGNGVTGENITSRFLSSSIKGVTLEYSDIDFEVRGEIYISDADFEVALYNRMEFEYAEWLKRNPTAEPVDIKTLVNVGQKNRMRSEEDKVVLKGKTNFNPEKHLYSNPRNAVSGALLRETVNYSIPMSFAAYDAYGEVFNGRDHVTRMSFVEAMGFSTALSLIPADVRQKPVLEVVEEFGNLRKEGTGYPTDGVVIKLNDIKSRSIMGEGSKAPRWAIAYKYPSNTRETVVQGIEISIGRTGRLSLRAKVAPILLDGTMINYASLHNVSWMEEKDIRIGDTVLLRRANDVIPYIEEAVPALRPSTAVAWKAPETCPQCGESWDKTTLLWRCPSPECGRLNGIIFAAGRDYFDWDGLSEAIITRLDDEGLIKDMADVFSLTKEQLSTLKMRKTDSGQIVFLGEKVGAKVYEQIQNSKSRPLSAVLAALGVRTLGRTFGRRLEAYFGDMTKIVKASPEQLTQVEGIAIKKAEIIHKGLQERLPLILKLAQAGVTMTTTKKEVSANSSRFVGKKVCITGSIPGYTRGQAQELLTEIGAIASSGVSSNTDYLIADEESASSSKYKNAVKFQKPIISPEDFLKELGK